MRSEVLKIFALILSPLIKAKGTKKRTSGAAAKMIPISLGVYPAIESTFGRKMI